MPDALEMHARHAQMLGRLAELGLALAADLQARALKAEDDAVAAQLADSFHKVGRSVRQSLALEAKLLRDSQAAVREAAIEDERTRPERIARRRAEVSAAVERLIWTELETHEFLMDEEADHITVAFVCDELTIDITDEEFAETSIPVLLSRLKPLVGPAVREAFKDQIPEPELRDSA